MSILVSRKRKFSIYFKRDMVSAVIHKSGFQSRLNFEIPIMNWDSNLVLFIAAAFAVAAAVVAATAAVAAAVDAVVD